MKKLLTEKKSNRLDPLRNSLTYELPKFLLVFFCLSFFSSALADPPKLISLRPGISSLTAFGSDYQSKSGIYFSIHGDYSQGLDDTWRLKLNFGGNISGEFQYLGVGLAYHLIPLVLETRTHSDNVKIYSFPKWSPYLGLDFAMTRVQLPLTSSSGDTTNYVLAALVGPIAHLGTLYTLGPSWSLVADGSVIYALSNEVAASVLGVSVGVVYTLGR